MKAPRGRGRPSLWPGQKVSELRLRIGSDLLDKVTARAGGRPLSDVVREALELWARRPRK